MNRLNESWLNEIKWNEQGLIPVIAQDYKSLQVLTLAWMNRAALKLTQTEQRAVYWSRSRKKIWRKGEESGFVQKIHEIRLDCDSDAIILLVEQIGGIACHTGRAHCFYKVLKAGEWQTVEPILKNPKTIYDNKP